MKRRQAYFRTEIRRLFRERELYFSVPGIVVILFLSANGGMGDIGESVLSAVLLSSYDAGFLIAFSLAAIPYGAVFTKELEYHYARYLVVRGSLRKYVLSKMLAVFISAMLAMGLGITCFSLLCSLGLPWTDEGIMEYMMLSGGYRCFLRNEQYLLWFLLYGLQWGILAGILAMAAAFFSLFWPNRLLVYSVPVLLYQISVEFGADSFRRIPALDPCVVFDARHTIWNSDMRMLAWALMLGAAAWLLLSFAGTLQLKRRI